MISSRPYLVRALIEWITDSQMTPYIAIAVDSKNVDIPSEYVTCLLYTSDAADE